MIIEPSAIELTLPIFRFKLMIKIKLTHRFDQLTPEKRPQDPHLNGLNGKGLRFKTMERGGEYPDTMPQAIKVTDAKGRSCIYVSDHARRQSGR